jgi:high frequency lysogenization protein
MSADREQTLALSAMFQALGCVQELSESGRCDAAASEAVIDAIFAIDSADAESLYPPTRLQFGFATAVKQLDRNPGDAIMRMGITVLRLERRLMTNPGLAKALRDRIGDIERTRTVFGGQHEAVLARLSEAYLQTLSNLWRLFWRRGKWLAIARRLST